MKANLLLKLKGAGVTQTELGRRIGVSQSAVWQWLAGKRPVPPKRAVQIERATRGRISRRALRPDWRAIWG